MDVENSDTTALQAIAGNVGQTTTDNDGEAMAICNGQNPDELTFDITRMRRHLYDCLEEKQMRHFPAHPSKRRQTICKKETIQVYCRCRLQEDGDMILCEKCDTWYHATCDTIQDGAWEKDSEWTCSICRQ